MNPGRRRLLIPGLLIVLIAVVALVALARGAEAQTQPIPPQVPSKQVSVMTDPRITESSGLAASVKHPGVVYTFNDSGHAAQLFAVNSATGKTVGVTTVVGATWTDAEAMSLHDGTVWIGDVGNGVGVRRIRAVYSFPEPGPGDHHVRATRYPVVFAAKETVDVEAMVVLPDRIDFYSKGWQGTVFSVSGPLKTNASNIARPTRRVVPGWTTDASATPDDRLVLVRGINVVEVRDAKTWKLRYSDVIPFLLQGESITVEPSGRSYLIGSEGKNSPLVRIAFEPDRVDAGAKPLGSVAQYKANHPVRWFIFAHQRALEVTALVGVVVLTAGAMALVWRWARRRRKVRGRGQ